MNKIGFVYFTNTDVTGKLVLERVKEIEGYNVSCVSHQILGSEIIEGRFENPYLMNQLKIFST